MGRMPGRMRILFLARDQRLSSSFVGFPFAVIIVLGSKIEIVHKELLAAVSEMARNLREFVKQAEPEIIDSVIPKRHTNDRRIIGKQHGRPVEIGIRQVWCHHEDDSVLCQKGLCALRAIIKCACFATLRRKACVVIPLR